MRLIHPKIERTEGVQDKAEARKARMMVEGPARDGRLDVLRAHKGFEFADRALQYYKDEEDEDCNWDDMKIAIAAIMVKTGNRKKALELVEEVVREMTTEDLIEDKAVLREMLKIRRSSALAKVGMFEEALEVEFEDKEKEKSAKYEVILEMSEAKRVDEAERSIREYADILDDKTGMAKQLLASAYAEIGMQEKAVRMYREELESCTGEGAVRKKGEIGFRMAWDGLYEEAAEIAMDDAGESM